MQFSAEPERQGPQPGAACDLRSSCVIAQSQLNPAFRIKHTNTKGRRLRYAVVRLMGILRFCVLNPVLLLLFFKSITGRGSVTPSVSSFRTAAPLQSHALRSCFSGGHVRRLLGSSSRFLSLSLIFTFKKKLPPRGGILHLWLALVASVADFIDRR